MSPVLTPPDARGGDAALRAENARLRAALAKDARVEAILEAVLVARGDPEDGTHDHLPRVLRNFLSEECGRAGLTGFDDGYAEGKAVAEAALDVARRETEAVKADLVEAREHGECAWHPDFGCPVYDGRRVAETERDSLAAMAGEAMAEDASSFSTAQFWEEVALANNQRRNEALAARDAALAASARDRADVERLKTAHDAAAYLANRYKTAWLGKRVRDLAEAEGAYETAKAALTPVPEKT